MPRLEDPTIVNVSMREEPTRYRAVVLTSWDRALSGTDFTDYPKQEAQ